MYVIVTFTYFLVINFQKVISRYLVFYKQNVQKNSVKTIFVKIFPTAKKNFQEKEIDK